MEEEKDPLQLGELNQAIDAFVAVLTKVNTGAPMSALAAQIEAIRKHQSALIEYATRDATAVVEMSAASSTPEPAATTDASVEATDWIALARELVDEALMPAEPQ